MADKLVLVTGACGFIAAHVIQQLLTVGYRVRGTVRSIANEDKVAPLRSLAPGSKHQLELVATDLCSDDGWDEAVAGCWAVIHVASTMPSITEDIPEEAFVVPAVQGTLRVMRASAKAGVKKMAITGSFSAVHGDPIPAIDNYTFTEEDWTDIHFPRLEPYPKSKTLAEMAAWDFIKELPDDKKMDLTVILPTFVWGPPLFKAHESAQSVVTMNLLLNHQYPGTPYLHGIFCDVRDVALAHVKSLTTPDAVGKRILIHTESQWLNDVAKMMATEFAPQGYTIFTNTVPYFILWIVSFFNKKIAQSGMLEKIGKEIIVGNKRMKEVLGIEPTPFQTTAFDMAYTMIDLGLTFKAKNYRKVGSRAEQ